MAWYRTTATATSNTYGNLCIRKSVSMYRIMSTMCTMCVPCSLFRVPYSYCCNILMKILNEWTEVGCSAEFLVNVFVQICFRYFEFSVVFMAWNLDHFSYSKLYFVIIIMPNNSQASFILQFIDKLPNSVKMTRAQARKPEKIYGFYN